MKKIIENITVDRFAAEGKCIAYHDEKVIFVDRVAPGDVVDIQIRKNKKSYLEGEAIHFHQYSDQRATPVCSHFGTCGGCKWQHIPYPTQLQLKAQQVADQLERIAQIKQPKLRKIIPSEDQLEYRNKLEFTFSNKKWLTKEEIAAEQDLDRRALGFHVPKFFDKIVDIEHCHLQAEPSNPVRNELRTFALRENLSFYDIKNHHGLLRNLIIRTSSTEEVMLIIQFGEKDDEDVPKVMEFLKQKFNPKSLFYIINTKKNDTFQDLEPVLYSGKPFIIEKIDSLSFQIGPKSFFQTNSKQTQKLYQVVKDFAQLEGNEIVYDLYTGIGTIALFLAGQCQKMVGLEYVPEAIKDAQVNAQINQISNATFFAGDIKDLLTEDFILEHQKPDVVIIDPPRAGMHADVVKALLKSMPEKIVYVSCNPATQARDLVQLLSAYRLEAVQPVDMFPHTMHVENVVLLIKK